MAPPGNQAATENTNFNLHHSENPVYSPKVGPIPFQISNFILQICNALSAKALVQVFIGSG